MEATYSIETSTFLRYNSEDHYLHVTDLSNILALVYVFVCAHAQSRRFFLITEYTRTSNLEAISTSQIHCHQKQTELGAGI